MIFIDFLSGRTEQDDKGKLVSQTNYAFLCSGRDEKQAIEDYSDPFTRPYGDNALNDFIHSPQKYFQFK